MMPNNRSYKDDPLSGEKRFEKLLQTDGAYTETVQHYVAVIQILLRKGYFTQGGNNLLVIAEFWSRWGAAYFPHMI